MIAAVSMLLAAFMGGAAPDSSSAPPDSGRAAATPTADSARAGIASPDSARLLHAAGDSILVLPEVRVDRDRPLPESRRRLPSAFVTEIHLDATRGAVTNLADALEEAAGVHVDRYGGLGAFSTVSLRGAPSGQVAVYLDGVPLTSAAHGVANLADLPVTALDRAEVYRGFSPLGFGAATPGGAVNLVTLSSPEVRELHVARGSFDTWEARGSAGATRGAFSGLVHLGYQGSAGDYSYWSDNGTPFNPGDDGMRTRANDRFDAATALASATWQPRPGWRALAREDFFQKTQGLAGAGTIATHTASLGLDRSLSHLELEAPGARLRPRATLLASLDDERTRDDDPAGELGYGRHRTDDVTTSRMLSLGLEWPRLVHGVALDAGGTLRSEFEDLHDPADGYPDPPESRRLTRAANVGVRLQPLGDWLTFHAAQRWDHLADRLNASGVAGILQRTDVARDLASPQLGARLVAGHGLELRGNWGRATRAPTFEELFGRAGSILGNATLKPETGENWDAGGSWSGAVGPLRGMLEGAHYESRSSDLVFWERVFQNVRPENLSRAYVRGEELSLRVEAPLGLTASGAMTWQRAVNEAPFRFWNGKALPLRPAREGSLRVAWRGGGWHLAADAHYLGDDWLDPANTTRVANRTLLGVSGGAPLVTRSLTLNCDLRNLGNDRVSDVGGYPLPGRSVFVALDFRGGATARP